MIDERMNESEEERRLRRRRRLEEMKREKQRALFIQRRVVPVAAVVIFFVMAVGTYKLLQGLQRSETNNSVGQMASAGSDNLEKGEYKVVTMPPEEPESQEPEASQPGTSDSSESGGPGESQAETLSAPDSSEAGETENPQAGEQSAQGQSESGESERPKKGRPDRPEDAEEENGGDEQPEEPEPPVVYEAVSTASTVGFADSIISEYGVVIDVGNSTILAQKNAKTRISPASMTKVLTLLTAADALGLSGEDWASNPVLDDTFTITIEITDYSFSNDCSCAGFEVGEEVTVRDLFYGTILPSGADAAVGLACYVAGSHEAFVDLMNQKAESLGLSETSHFTNCVGLYDENLYSTVYDIAVILKTASDNPFCRDVLSARAYNTVPTEQHPSGIVITNSFLRKIDNMDINGKVLCAKTGYVSQAKSCAASLAADMYGNEFICVTATSSSTTQCLKDQAELYRTWLTSISE